jgi:hypothetical protein
MCLQICKVLQLVLKVNAIIILVIQQYASHKLLSDCLKCAWHSARSCR